MFFIVNNTNTFSRFMVAVKELFRYRIIGKEGIQRDLFYRDAGNQRRIIYFVKSAAMRWFELRMVVINSLFLMALYAFIEILIFIDKNTTTTDILRYSLCFSWALKLISHTKTMLNSIISLHSDILSYAQLKYQIENMETRKEIVYKEPTGQFCGVNERKLSLLVEIHGYCDKLSGKEVLSKVNITFERYSKTMLVGGESSGLDTLVDMIVGLQ